MGKRTWLKRCPCGDYFDGASPTAKFCPRHEKLKPKERKALLKRRVW